MLMLDAQIIGRDAPHLKPLSNRVDILEVANFRFVREPDGRSAILTFCYWHTAERRVAFYLSRKRIVELCDQANYSDHQKRIAVKQAWYVRGQLYVISVRIRSWHLLALETNQMLIGDNLVAVCGGVNNQTL
jgi:hypothetical protein